MCRIRYAEYFDVYCVCKDKTTRPSDRPILGFINVGVCIAQWQYNKILRHIRSDSIVNWDFRRHCVPNIIATTITHNIYAITTPKRIWLSSMFMLNRTCE